ncbi:cadherin-like and PC-esterase domain-containing protein 1 [Exaiptasia diaphana]|uniref:NXPE C-terminal domain-containing protein n=1 Tax=Exaiptasia diaphana TaxID=2652724 RepID=A0A913X6P3_EXADI|nr:cadherin-like and PC-esterase domain-containing protein 1 [Exaiptasia diaphana]
MEAKTCLVKKKILFVGDSTNRGMMYYLMQKINGSLHQWEKTHSMKVYSSALNDDQTSVSFAYFPQFWLPSYRKPDFLKALHHLMAKFMPLYNSTDTILVVGGVQWLRPSHVTAIKSTLISLGLSGIKVIIKTLGSGFHLPVPGVVELDSEGQMKVSRRNELLIKTSVAAGFEVIDTHTMTITRYKEFLTGKCGCHFHKVVDLKSHSKEVVDILRDEQKNGHPRYHVLGSINSAYSDIMISRMCS